MSFRSRYWTCSRFADWIRGEEKPEAASFEEWDKWRFKTKIANPIRYWIAEEGLGYLQDTIFWIPDQLHSLSCYVNNRWVTKTHCLKTGLEPGSWYDLDTRLLHGIFNELVEFVEIECAWIGVCFDSAARKKYHVPWWRRWCRVWRSPEAGIEHLKWASSLVFDESCGADPNNPEYGKPTPQAISAKKILEIYYWWKTVRPNRADPHDVSGWTKYCNEKEGSIFSTNESEEQKENVRKMLDFMSSLEAQYEKEDTEMMKQLIEIRASLWT